ncbi:MAG: isochorismatase family protein [Candidatus Heimdallarchaeaceae archaeon]
MLKEEYFSHENQNEKVKEWLKECAKYKTFKPFKLDLSKAALLVLDMQKFFLSEESHAFIPSSRVIIPIIQKLIQKMSELNRPIIFTRHISSDNENNLMNKIWKDPIEIDQKKSEISEQVKTRGIILIKRHYSAFKETSLEAILQRKKISQILITGVMTHLCCETTAREAFMLGFQPFFVIDANATYNEDLHLGTLKAITHGFGVTLSSREVLNWKRKTK